MMHFETIRRREREIVRVMVEAVLAAGWKLAGVDDGGDEEVRVNSADEVVEVVFAVDEARVFFWREREAGDQGPGSLGSWAFFVVGEGDDILADYGTRIEEPLGAAARKLGLEWPEV